MTGARAHTERTAVDVLASDLRHYTARMQSARELVEQRLAAADARAGAAVDRARGQLAQRIEALNACLAQEEADCRSAADAVDHAKRRLEQTYAVAREVTALSAQHRPASRRFGLALETLGREVQHELARAGATLDTYLGASSGSEGHRSVGSSIGGATAPAEVGPTQPPGFPDDVFMIPLAMVDDSDTRIHGPAEFSQFYSPADLEWAHEQFLSVVLPGLARGATVEDFRARDARENRLGTRSYEMTCAGFLGTDAIAVSRTSGGAFEVTNGYHRIWVARRMGLDAVPARVVGHGGA